MEKMYSDSSLTALVAVASMPVEDEYFSFPFARARRHHFFQLNDARWALDKLSFSEGVLNEPEYRRFILEFLEDHNRSGIYALNGQRYMTAAVYFLKQIQTWEQITPSYRSHFTYNKIDWLWLGLKCLVHVMPRSDSSEELTVLVHQLKLAPLSGGDTRQTIAVNQEIDRYLARIE